MPSLGSGCKTAGLGVGSLGAAEVSGASPTQFIFHSPGFGVQSWVPELILCTADLQLFGERTDAPWGAGWTGEAQSLAQRRPRAAGVRAQRRAVRFDPLDPPDPVAKGLGHLPVTPS